MSFGPANLDENVVKPIAKAAWALGNVIIVRKGITDIITDGKKAFYVIEEGS